jgi:hypothetical protein
MNLIAINDSTIYSMLKTLNWKHPLLDHDFLILCELCPSIHHMCICIVSRCHSHWVKFAKNLCPNLTPPGQLSSLWEKSINLIEWVAGFFFQLSEIAIMARWKHSSWLKWLVLWNVCMRGRQLGFVFSKHLVIYIYIYIYIYI